MTKRTANYYTLGRVASAPTSHVSGSKVYQTVYVELFGGMRVSAIAGTQEISKGMYVGVRCTPKSNGETTYTVFGFNDAAQTMIKSAAAYIETAEGETPRDSRSNTTTGISTLPVLNISPLSQSERTAISSWRQTAR